MWLIKAEYDLNKKIIWYSHFIYITFKGGFRNGI